MNLENSPLMEPNPESLGTLFQRDPLSLSNQEVERICKELRAQRAQWKIEDKLKADKKSAPKKSKPVMDAELNSILDGLI